MNLYRPGDTVAMTADITVGGAPEDASLVTVTIQPPGGSQMSFTCAPSAVYGTYSYYYTLPLTPVAAPGIWKYRFTASGSTGGSGTGSFLVGPPTF
jgi:hypothetical protein